MAGERHLCPKCGALLAPPGDTPPALVRVDCGACGAVVAVRLGERSKARRRRQRPTGTAAAPDNRGNRGVFLFGALILCTLMLAVLATRCETW